MSRNYERDEREAWRRQQQNRQGQNRWFEGGREDNYGWTGEGQQGRDWRGEEDYGRGQQMYGGGQRRQGMQRPWGNPNEREMWEGGGSQRGGAWQTSDRGWDRGNEDWQGGRGGGWQGDRWQGGRGPQDRGWDRDYSQYGRGGNWNERYEGGSQHEGFGGRDRNWNQNMGGGWNQNQESGGWNQGNRGWNEGMRVGNEGQYSGRGPRSYKRADNRFPVSRTSGSFISRNSADKSTRYRACSLRTPSMNRKRPCLSLHFSPQRPDPAQHLLPCITAPHTGSRFQRNKTGRSPSRMRGMVSARRTNRVFRWHTIASRLMT